MTGPLAGSSLEEFRAAAASGEPTPAGVAIAAASASFALGLLAKVVQVSSRHKKFAEHAARLKSLAEAATVKSRQMIEKAEEDVAAFKAYVSSSRLPQSTNREREARRRSMSDAVRRAIEVPLGAAHSAAAGLDLCAEASSITHVAVIADLGAAASLLANAMRIFLVCADSNLRQLAPDPSRFRGAFADRSEWEARANRQAEAVLTRVASILDSLPGKAAF